MRFLSGSVEKQLILLTTIISQLADEKVKVREQARRPAINSHVEIKLRDKSLRNIARIFHRLSKAP